MTAGVGVREDVRDGWRRPGEWNLHRWYLTIGGCLLGLYLFVPPFEGAPLVIGSISASSAVAILVGIRVHRPSAVWPWRLFAAGQLLFFLGDVYTILLPTLFGHEVPFPSPGDAFYIAMYPVLMVGVLLVVRRRTPQGDRAGVIDAVILAVGIGLLSWVFLIVPYVTDATLSPLAKGVSIAYPVGDLLLLAATLRLVIGGGRRQGSFYLLVVAAATLFITDAGYGYALLDGTFHHQLIYDAGWISYYLLWGSAALHPSMRTLAEATPDRERQLSRPRLVLLTSASVLAPAVEIVRSAQHGSVELVVILAASIVLFVLVVVRVSGLVRQFERSAGRERALGEGGAALVSASRPHEIHVAALETACSLVAGLGDVCLCLETPAGLTRFRRDDETVTGRPVLDPAVEDELRQGGVLGPVARLQLGLPTAAVYATALAIGTPGNRRGLIVVGSDAPISPLIERALQTLADSVSLALGSAAAVEDMHRREGEERFASLVRNATDLTTVVDQNGTVTYQSPSIERILGVSAERVQRRDFQGLLSEDESVRILALLAEQRRLGVASYSFECTLRHADGRELRFEMLATDLTHDEHVRGVVLNGRCIAERAAFEEQLAHQAFHDPVTDLPNRTLFSDRVEHAIGRAERTQTSSAVIFLDLDDFKTVNDSLGHPAGDSVLREVARRLREVTRETDTLARFGGDEFAVLLEDVASPQAPVEMADRIIATFERAVPVEGQEISIRPSLGIALAGPFADSAPVGADELVRNADAAMYICKRAGEGGYRVFEAAMHARVLERLELRAELRRAIDTGQFELHYQPLVDLQTGAIAGLEALCRWRHPTRGLVPPDQFIPLAEESGLIVEIGRWVLQEGCRQAVAFHAALAAGTQLRLSVNLSVKQLQHPQIVADTRGALACSGLDPSMLTLEITESVMMADATLAAVRLGQLRDLGARIAMDDFGTGYSSLSYLSQFPVDMLKMDRSFLAGVGSVRASGLTAAIVSLGSTLELEVVAEGIEHRSQLAGLRALGCQIGQGYLFAPPMSADDTNVWLHEMQARGGFDVAGGSDGRQPGELEAA